jgi:hypothetical protein
MVSLGLTRSAQHQTP